MRLPFIIFAALLVGLTSSARASHGGPQTIELVGFDARQNEIIFLRHFEDEYDHGTNFLPQIYRLSLEPNGTAVKVDSPFYGSFRRTKEQAGEPYDFRENEAGFHASIRVLKATLAPLTPLTPVHPHIRVTTKKYFVENTADESVRGWSLLVALTIDGWSGDGQVTNYCDRQVRLQRWLRLPKPGWSIAVVSHKGVPQEGCYDSEDIIVLRRQTSDK